MLDLNITLRAPFTCLSVPCPFRPSWPLTTLVFDPQEVSSSAEWVRQAAGIAQRKHQQDGGMREQKVTLWRANRRFDS